MLGEGHLRWVQEDGQNPALTARNGESAVTQPRRVNESASLIEGDALIDSLDVGPAARVLVLTSERDHERDHRAVAMHRRVRQLERIGIVVDDESIVDPELSGIRNYAREALRREARQARQPLRVEPF